MNYKEVFQLAQDKGYEMAFLNRLSEYEKDTKRFEIALSETVLLELTLIQKWLRDEHKLQMMIITSGTKDNLQYVAIMQYCYLPDTEMADELRKVGKRIPYSTTYEQALLEGINEALKLI